MLELKGNHLTFSFPDVHKDAKCTIDLHRTLRVPEDGETHSLPCWLGSFPVCHVDDFKGNVPGSWVEHGGVMMPMWQSEAMWLQFIGDYPCAVKIAAGKINALTGDQWTDGLNTNQDYCVTDKQPWIDGFCSEKGKVRQFVAAALGEGRTVEEQVTGKAEHGGIQIIVYPMKRDHYEKLRSQTKRASGVVYADGAVNITLISPYYQTAPNTEGIVITHGTSTVGTAVPRGVAFENTVYANSSTVELNSSDIGVTMFDAAAPLDMGLGAGGEIKQEIYDDPFGIDAWDTDNGSRCFLHLCNSHQWKRITGSMPPTKPITEAQYAARGYRWYQWYGDTPAIEGSSKLKNISGVSHPTPKGTEKNPIRLGPGSSVNVVRDGTF